MHKPFQFIVITSWHCTINKNYSYHISFLVFLSQMEIKSFTEVTVPEEATGGVEVDVDDGAASFRGGVPVKRRAG